MIFNASHILFLPAKHLLKERKSWDEVAFETGVYNALKETLSNEFEDSNPRVQHLIHNVGENIFNGECKLNYGNYIPLPDESDFIMFHNDIISNNGKMIANCAVVDTILNSNEHHKKNLLLYAAGLTFLTTQKPRLIDLVDYRKEVKIDDNFESIVFINDDLYKINLISPNVLWTYMHQKVISSKNLEDATVFDERHPHQDTFNILESTFEYNKIEDNT